MPWARWENEVSHYSKTKTYTRNGKIPRSNLSKTSITSVGLSALPPSSLWSAELGWSCLYSLQISALWKFFRVNKNSGPPLLNCTMPALCQHFHNRWVFMQLSNKRKDLMVSQFLSPQMISTYIWVQFPALLAVYAVYIKQYHWNRWGGRGKEFKN